MGINFKDKMILVCIPKSKAFPVPPKDQSPCILESCPICKKLMWVSERKRKMRKEKSNVEIYCAPCALREAKKYNAEIEIIDIDKVN